ncbi:MBL fold metallo-hydrolase [Bacteroidota bacterium]
MKNKKLIKIIKINTIIIFLIGVPLMLVNQSCSSARYAEGEKPLSKIDSSPQFKDGKFHNHVSWEQPDVGEYIGTMWDFVFSDNDRTPESNLPSMKADIQKFSNKDSNQLNAAWLGHSSLMINIDGYKILTDPVFETRVSFFGPARYNGDTPLDINELPEIDLVLISHNHYDHLNNYTIERINNKVKRFIVPLAVGAELEEWGVPREKITELDWWEEINIDENLMVAFTPTQHFSGRGITDRDETLWGSYVVKSEHHKIYFSGDSGYFDGFKKIGDKYGPFNMTFLECGAYNEKWHHIHMYPEETVQAHLDLKGDLLHPIHWGTFNLSLHSWYEPMERVAEAAGKNNVKLALPVVGETTEYQKYIPTVKWWKLKADKININSKLAGVKYETK